MESPLDCPRVNAVGIAGIGPLATYGVRVSRAQFRLLRTLTDDVIIALDHDKDGLKLAEEIRNEYRGWFNLRFMSYDHTDAKDPGDMSNQSVRLALKNARSSIYKVT
jgi:5S rRNA maturation endonuclease (ribonuclease M5)